MNLVLRTEFNSYLEDALGSLLKFTGTELCALGDWQDRKLGEAHALLGALKAVQDFTVSQLAGAVQESG